MDFKNILDLQHKFREEKTLPHKLGDFKLKRKDEELTAYIFLELLLQTLVWDFQGLE